MKKLSVLIFILFSFYTKGFSQDITFDKIKWRDSASFRYDFARDGNFTTLLKTKTKREVKKLLGKPSIHSKEKNYLIYCFDIQDSTIKSNKWCRCPGSSIVIEFKEGRVKDITTVMVN